MGKQTNAERVKRWRAAHPERAKEAARGQWANWHARNPGYSRDRRLRSAYGLTPAGYADMLAAQSGVCGICQLPEKGNKNLSVDHDHETGQVRGLLCDRCNKALGLFEDDPSRMAAAIQYLTRAANG